MEYIDAFRYLYGGFSIPEKVIYSPNTLSQKSRRRRAKWSNKK